MVLERPREQVFAMPCGSGRLSMIFDETAVVEGERAGVSNGADEVFQSLNNVEVCALARG